MVNNFRKENALTDEKRNQLKQGTKVEFKWYGSKELQIGRIEVNCDRLYYCPEPLYDNNGLTEMGKSLQYYNPLDSYFFFTYFVILK